MQQADQATRVADGLLEPDDVFVGAGAGVFVARGVFVLAEVLVGGGDGEDEEEGEGGAGEEGEQGGVAEGVDVVEGEGRGEAELVD